MFLKVAELSKFNKMDKNQPIVIIGTNYGQINNPTICLDKKDNKNKTSDLFKFVKNYLMSRLLK